jgi:hypothetical protein
VAKADIQKASLGVLAFHQQRAKATGAIIHHGPKYEAMPPIININKYNIV